MIFLVANRVYICDTALFEKKTVCMIFKCFLRKTSKLLHYHYHHHYHYAFDSLCTLLDYVYSLHPDKSPGNPIKHPRSLPKKTKIFYSTPDCLAGARQPKCLPDGAVVFNWDPMKHYSLTLPVSFIILFALVFSCNFFSHFRLQ